MRQRAIDLRAFLSKAAAAALLVAVATAPGLAGAVTFTEVGDAGQTPLTAQNTGNTGAPLTSIFGSIFSNFDADLFVIDIANPAIFSASTVNLFTDNFLDTQLFLFSAAGAPIFANDDDAGGLSLQSSLPAGNALGPITAGRYLIGVSLSFNDAVNAVSQLLFTSGLSTDLRGPNGGLQPAFLSGFSGNGFGSGNYRIDLVGAANAVTPVPEPSLWLMLAVGVAGIPVLNRRRRALRGESRTVA